MNTFITVFEFNFSTIERALERKLGEQDPMLALLYLTVQLLTMPLPSLSFGLARCEENECALDVLHVPAQVYSSGVSLGDLFTSINSTSSHRWE